MNKSRIALATTILSIASQYVNGGSGFYREEESSQPLTYKPTFSEEEINKLSNLHGKNKKNFLKQLKEKYSNL